jgi:oxaloacetate decarboxylase (Na+ extruding) subunit alpha
VPIHLHTHYTSGMAMAAVLKAIEAGVDIVDTAISALALVTSQPPTESLVRILQESPRDTGLDLGLLAEISPILPGCVRNMRPLRAGWWV